MQNIIGIHIPRRHYRRKPAQLVIRGLDESNIIGVESHLGVESTVTILKPVHT
jgi:hypothetical protein